MNTRTELIGMMVRLRELARIEERAGNCDTAELIASAAKHIENVLVSTPVSTAA